MADRGEVRRTGRRSTDKDSQAVLSTAQREQETDPPHINTSALCGRSNVETEYTLIQPQKRFTH